MMQVTLVGTRGGCGFKSHQVYLNGLETALAGLLPVEMAYWPVQRPISTIPKGDKRIWHLTSQDLAGQIPRIKHGKIILTCHDLFPVTVSRPFIHSGYLKKFRAFLPLIRKANRLIVLSRYAKEELIDFGIPETRISVVGPAIDEKRFRPRNDGASLFKTYPFLKPNKKYLLTVASSIERKNLLRMLMAFCQVRKQTGDLEYVIVLDNVDPAGMREVLFGIRLLGLKGKIHLLSKVSADDLAKLYSLSLGLIYASLAENFGFPILEAMSCGCPVLCSSNTASRETAGNAALLANPVDVEDLAGKLRRLVDSPLLRRELQKKGLKRVKAFTREKVAARLLRAYRSD